MFNPRIYENSRPDGIGVLEILGESESGDQKQGMFVPLKKTELRGDVTGPLANFCVEHIYGYSKEQCDKVLEAVYRFPLPGDSAVTGVRVRFGSVVIRALLKERQIAEQDYQEAKQQGKQATLLSRESPDVFTLHVAGIKPDEEVSIETSYVQLAKAEGSGWSLRIPLTTSPRYVRSDEVESRHAQGQPLAILRDPGHRFSLDLGFEGVGEVRSSTHKLETEKNEKGLRVKLMGGEVLPDRDCVLIWKPLQEEKRPLFNVLLHEDPSTEQIYFMALLTPPGEPDPDKAFPRESILLVDHSGSMEGAKWQASDWAVNKFLSDLTKKDLFNLGLFHNTTRWFSNKPVSGDEGNIKKAVNFLHKHHDSGGTELGVALEQALHLNRKKGESARHILIITDAEVSDEGRVIRLAEDEAKNQERRRISVLCIDSAPNSLLANELAEKGGGIARFLTSSPNEEDITTALDEILLNWTMPVLVGLKLEINYPGVVTDGKDTVEKDKKTIIDLGDLPSGRPIWITGCVPQNKVEELSFIIKDSKENEILSSHIKIEPGKENRPGVKALFGSRLVLGLELLINSGRYGDQLKDGLKRLGYDADAVMKSGTSAKVYAENVFADARKVLTALLVSESLNYRLACSETSFIAVREEKGDKVEGTVQIANALAEGWSDNFISFLKPAHAGIGVRRSVMMQGVPCIAPPPPPMQAPTSPSTGSLAPSGGASIKFDLMDTAKPKLKKFRAEADPSPQPAKGGIGGFLSDSMQKLGDMFAGGGDDESLYQAMPGKQMAMPKSEAPMEMEEDKKVAFEGRRSVSEAKPAARPVPTNTKPILFSGKPVIVDGEAVLFDSSRGEDSDKLPDNATLSKLILHIDGTPDKKFLHPDIQILIFVDDPVSPRAKVKLSDLMKQKGERPLNIRRTGGKPVKIVLVDPTGNWSSSPLGISLRLEWKY